MTDVDNALAIRESLQAAKKEQALDAYSKIVRNLANGEDVDWDGASPVLETLGKSDDDIRADIELLRKRQKAIKLISESGDVLTEQNRAIRRLEQHKEKREKFLAKWREDEKALFDARSVAMQAAWSVSEAQKLLMTIGLDPRQTSRLEAIRESRRELSTSIRKANYHLSSLNVELKRFPGDPSLVADKKSAEERLEEHRSKATELENEYDRLMEELVAKA